MASVVAEPIAVSNAFSPGHITGFVCDETVNY